MEALQTDFDKAQILTALNKAGLNFAFPTQTILLEPTDEKL